MRFLYMHPLADSSPVFIIFLFENLILAKRSFSILILKLQIYQFLHKKLEYLFNWKLLG